MGLPLDSTSDSFARIRRVSVDVGEDKANSNSSLEYGYNVMKGDEVLLENYSRIWSSMSP